MPCKVHLTERFKKDAKKLAKKYKSLGKDLSSLVSELEQNPYLGDRISPNSYKIRIAIKSKGRGKSGGGRVISYVNVAIEQGGEIDKIDVYLLTIYDKSDVDSLPLHIVNGFVKDFVTEEE